MAQPVRHPTRPEPPTALSACRVTHGPVRSGRPCNAAAACSIAIFNNTDALTLGIAVTEITAVLPTGRTAERSQSSSCGVRPSHGRHTLLGRRCSTHRRSTTAVTSERNLTDPSTVARPIPARPEAAHHRHPPFIKPGVSSSTPCAASVASLRAGSRLTPMEGPPTAPSTATGQAESINPTTTRSTGQPEISPRCLVSQRIVPSFTPATTKPVTRSVSIRSRSSTEVPQITNHSEPRLQSLPSSERPRQHPT